MSFIQSRIRCNHCRTEMNVAFGMVGTQQIAGWPEQCPKCGLSQFTKIAVPPDPPVARLVLAQREELNRLAATVRKDKE